MRKVIYPLLQNEDIVLSGEWTGVVHLIPTCLTNAWPTVDKGYWGSPLNRKISASSWTFPCSPREMFINKGRFKLYFPANLNILRQGRRVVLQVVFHVEGKPYVWFSHWVVMDSDMTGVLHILFLFLFNDALCLWALQDCTSMITSQVLDPIMFRLLNLIGSHKIYYFYLVFIYFPVGLWSVFLFIHIYHRQRKLTCVTLALWRASPT